MLNLPKRKPRMRFSLRNLMPSRLFARAFLILVLPMLLSQLVITHVFFNRHWDSVSRNMANAVVGDVVWLHETFEESYRAGGAEAALTKTQPIAKQLSIGLEYLPTNRPVATRGLDKRLFPDLYKGISERLKRPIALRLEDSNGQMFITTTTVRGHLVFAINRKQVTSPTTGIFMLWLVGISLLFTGIATLFLRNQVRPIVQLARVAERLGLGQEVDDFKPSGASEVRRAGRAFLVMRERIRRQVQSRTEMLAGISHDLRTPLTRMKLELELATMDAVTRKALGEDIDEMGKMIDEYLDFARGDAGEAAEPMDVNLLLADVVSDYTRSGRNVQFEAGAPVELMLRPQAIRRALTNLIDNALRYGGGVAKLSLELNAGFARIKVVDEGNGIAPEKLEEVFKPFTRLEPSRNSLTGGVGLGLSIARAVAQHHGGDISLENQRDAAGNITGLEATLRLPRAVQN
jgi:two-component system osmolarity sensor histidine kinase EnvZ